MSDGDDPLERLRGSVTYITEWFIGRYDIPPTTASSALRSVADGFENRGER